MNELKTSKLYELPEHQNIKLYGMNGLDNKPVVVIFDHIDGAYSYCWLNGEPEKVVHLSASTKLKQYKDGWKVL